MIRGTTPTITYRFPFETTALTKIRIYFMQGNETLLTLREEDCVIEGNTVKVTLKEEETYAFNPKKRIDTQVRFLTEDGTVGASKPKYIDVDEIAGEIEILADEDEQDEEQSEEQIEA